MSRRSSGIEPLENRIAPAAAIFELSSLDGSNGFKLSGVAGLDYSSSSVSDAGDVNGDGFGDLIIGASRADPNGSASGATYVIFGAVGGFATNLNLSTLDGTNGFKLSGVAAGSYSGFSVSAAGDVNGDGFDDLIMGAYRADPNGEGTGASYVVFGKASGFAANLNLSTLDGSNGFRLSGVTPGDVSGRAVSAAGDVNGDGFGDVIIGAYRADPNGDDSGASYVVFGKASAFAANLNLSTLDGSNGFRISGVALGNRSGDSVSAAGDVNRDGFGDLIIGASGTGPTGQSGASYVVFGKAGGFAADLNLSTLNGNNGFKLSGAAPGAVSDAGDVNGDGFDDVIIGASRADPNGSAPGAGASYVVFGKAGGFAADLNLSTLNGNNGFKLSGVAAGDQSGASVSAAGDFNGDGFGDLIVGALGADPNFSYSGASYVVFGKASGFAANLNLSTLDGGSGFKLNGIAVDDRSGRSVSAAGDVNRDGFGDLIIGADNADANGSNSGASYVVFGSALGPFAKISISDASIVEPLNGTAIVSFTVTLSSPSAQTVSVQYSAADGTANAPGDYMAGGLTTLTFAPGETSKSAQVPVHANSPSEPDETFLVNLSNPTNAIIADGQAQGTILDETTARAISIDDVTVREGDSGTVQAVFTVRLSNSSNQPVTVRYVTADGTATAAGDYTRVDNLLTFAPEEVSKSVVVAIRGDTVAEGLERFFLNLSNPTNATIADAQAQVLILDNDTINPGVFELAALDGSNGFKLSGVDANDGSGNSVSDAGDVNGDGFGDLIIGAWRADSNGSASGASYVVFGKASGFTPDLNLASLDGSNGFKLSGVAFGDRSGTSVSAAGDFNGDGFGDLIIGAIGPGNFAGASYVVFGKASGFTPDLNLSSLDGSNGFKLSGVDANDFSGRSVSDAGDVNGDGFADLIIGASGAGTSSGASYVVFGKAGGFAANLNLSSLDGRNGFRLRSVAFFEGFGYSVSLAGDVNGDGFGDLIIGAPGISGGSPNGASYVVFGKVGGFAANLDLSSLDGINGFKLSGVVANDRSGFSVSDAGDVNGDGFDDLIIGAHVAGPNGIASGESYVVFGKTSGFATNLNLSTLDGTNGFKLSGVAASDVSGRSVSDAGDVNGDGVDDLIIGAFGADPNGDESGASYVVFGKAGGFAANLDLSTLDRSNGFKLNGAVPDDYSGYSVSAAGDVNGDGVGDLIIGARGADANGSNSGASYVVFGQGPPPPTLTINDVTVVEGSSGTAVASFAISLSAPSRQSVTVQYATAEGTATAPGDYAAVDLTTVTFAPGEVTKSVSVVVSSDTVVEPNEDFLVRLSNPTNAVLLDPIGQGTILNDEPPLVSLSDARIAESPGDLSVAVFTISLSVPTTQSVTVEYATADGTATAPADYTAVPPTLVTFNPGEVLKTVTVSIPGDSVVEADETFFVNLTNPANATLGDTDAQATITDIAVSNSGKDATFIDADGDRVTVEASNGALSASNFVFGLDGTLQKIDLSKGNFTGANIIVRAQKNGAGDGLVNVGAIDATGLQLGVVTVTGDLGQIDVGAGGKALKSLTVGSLGALGAATQAEDVIDPLLSKILGSLPKLTVQRDVQDAIVEVSDKLGKVLIGGSLIDSGPPAQPRRASGSIGVFLNGGIPPVSASHSGTIFAPNIGSVTVMGDVDGGEISAETQVKNVKVLGSLRSDDPLDPAILRVGATIDNVHIKGDVQNALVLAGYDRALVPQNPDAKIGKVTVNGNWTASSMVAGVADPNDNGFGRDDALITGDGTPALVSRIASVIIQGTAMGSGIPTDHSAITAQKISSLRISGIKVPLTNGADNLPLDPIRQNFRAVEI